MRFRASSDASSLRLRHATQNAPRPSHNACELFHTPDKFLLPYRRISARGREPTETLPDLRGRTLIATLTYSAARITTALKVKIEDLRPRRGAVVRLHEKGGKRHTMPCKVLSENPMSQPDAWRMIRGRAAAAGIAEAIGCHTFRATGITAYLANGGALEHAQEIAAHESPRTTKLYDRTKERLTQDEVERIRL
jgi:integrase